MDFTSTTEQKVHVRLEPKTVNGKPATVDGKPEWLVESGNATVEVDEDGLGAWFVSADTAGQSTWRVKADADLGEGVRTIEEFGTYTYTDAQAENLNASAEAPVLK